MKFKQKHLLLAIFIISLLTYLYTLCPTIFFGDSAEIISAIAVNGVPHPTGFPTFLMLAKVFSLIPLGEMAYRINLFCALTSVLNVILVFLLIMRVNKNKIVSFISSLTYAFGATVWFHATYTQTYSLTTFFGLSSLLLAFKFIDSRKNKHLFLSMFLCGLGLGVHISMLSFVAAIFILLIFNDFNYFKKNVLKFASSCLFICLGLLVFMYIPFLSSKNPVINWDSPNTLSKFHYYITQKQWSSVMFARLGPHQTYEFVKRLFTFFTREFTIPGFLLIIHGIAIYFKKNRKLSFVILSGIFVNIFLLYAYGDYKHIEVLYRYFLPTYVFFAVFISVSLGHLFIKLKLFLQREFKTKEVRFFFKLFFLLLLPLLNFVLHFKFANKKHVTYAIDHARNLVTNLSDGDSLIVYIEDDVFPLLYLKHVLNETRGINIYDRYGNVFGDMYRLDHDVQSTTEQIEAYRRERDLEVLKSTQGSVYITDTVNHDLKYSNYGLYYKVKDEKEDEGSVISSDDLFSKYTTPLERTLYHDYKHREQFARYSIFKSRGYIVENRLGEAIESIETAVRVCPESWYIMETAAFIYNKLGNEERTFDIYKQASKTLSHHPEPAYNVCLIHLKRNQQKEAEKACRQALNADGNFIPAKQILDSLRSIKSQSKNIENQVNLDNLPQEASSSASQLLAMGISYGQQGNAEKAIENFEQATMVDDTNITAYINLGSAYMNLFPPKPAEARIAFERVISLDPSNALVYLNLGSICAYHLQDNDCVVQNWEKYLELEPNSPEKKKILKELERMK